MKKVANFRKLEKNHRGGCVLYCLAMQLSEDLESVCKKVNKKVDDWVYEKELYFLEEIFPIKIENFSNEKTIGELEKENVVTILDVENSHSFIVYGYEKILSFYRFLAYGPNGKFFNVGLRKLKSCYAIYRIS